MSHDRGCPCGKEFYEYHECRDHNCTRIPNARRIELLKLQQETKVEPKPKLKIALDYDGTYTRNPQFWATFVNMASAFGIDLRVVTHRHEEHDRIADVPNGVRIMYTDGIAKQWYCEHREDFWTPDIWIDDKPRGILENGPLNMQQIAEWRATRDA